MLTKALEACVGLANLPPCPSESFVAAGFELIGAVLGCRDGAVILNRQRRAELEDPLLGFQPTNLWLVGPRSAANKLVADAVMTNQALLAMDPLLQQMAREHGTHRIYHAPDPRKTKGHEHSIDAWSWEARGLVDQLKGVHALEPGIELVLIFHRFKGEPPFTREERVLLLDLLPAFSVWVRRVAWLHGIGTGLEPLSPRERQMLVALLGSAPQKHFAAQLDVSATRARELIREVHRKLGTRTRAELQRGWMSDRVELAVPPVDHLGRRKSPRQAD